VYADTAETGEADSDGAYSTANEEEKRKKMEENKNIEDIILRLFTHTHTPALFEDSAFRRHNLHNPDVAKTNIWFIVPLLCSVIHLLLQAGFHLYLAINIDTAKHSVVTENRTSFASLDAHYYITQEACGVKPSKYVEKDIACLFGLDPFSITNTSIATGMNSTTVDAYNGSDSTALILPDLFLLVSLAAVLILQNQQKAFIAHRSSSPERMQRTLDQFIKRCQEEAKPNYNPAEGRTGPLFVKALQRLVDSKKIELPPLMTFAGLLFLLISAANDPSFISFPFFLPICLLSWRGADVLVKRGEPFNP
jgi:hypothetical protein